MTKSDMARTLHAQRCNTREIAAAIGWPTAQVNRALSYRAPAPRNRPERDLNRLCRRWVAAV